MSITKSDIEFLMKHFNDLVECLNKQSELIQQFRKECDRLQKHNEELQHYNVSLAESEFRLKQERNELKSIISFIDSKIPLTPNTFSGSYTIAIEQSDIDQLRQKGQESE